MKHLKNQKGLGAFEGVIIVVALVAIGAAGYFAYQARQDKTDYSVSVPGKTESRQTAEGAKVVDESLYTITLPGTWKKVSKSSSSYVNEFGKGNYYEDSEGNYFAAYIDGPGRGFDSDASWGLVVKGSKLSIADEQYCSEASTFCTIGDGEYRIGISIPNVKYNGHEYFFLAGNSKKEKSVNTATYKEIIESIRAK